MEERNKQESACHFLQLVRDSLRVTLELLLHTSVACRPYSHGLHLGPSPVSAHDPNCVVETPYDVETPSCHLAPFHSL